ncbi:hypothetical protein MMC12_007223 [Toensbergia leucococca]|nr:hypothetical protein [Toensbergia leucococca]
MANGDTSSIYNTPLFTILAGPTRTPFQVHSGLLKKHKRLCAVIEGTWKESSDKQIVWEEWDEDIVENLVDWIYKGDYTFEFPELTPRSQEDTAGQMPIDSVKRTAVEGETLLMLSSITLNADDEIAIENVFPHHHFADHLGGLSKSFALPHPPPATSQVTIFENWTRNLKDLPPFWIDFIPPFLTHAKMYVIANYLLLPELKSLALDRLRILLQWVDQKTLTGSELASEVLELMRYIYDNTDQLVSELEPLRNVIVTFVAVQFTCFEGTEFTEMMEKGGDLAVDLSTRVGQITDWFYQEAGKLTQENESLASQLSSAKATNDEYSDKIQDMSLELAYARERMERLEDSETRLEIEKEMLQDKVMRLKRERNTARELIQRQSEELHKGSKRAGG